MKHFSMLSNANVQREWFNYESMQKYKNPEKINVNRASLVFDIFIPETIQTKPKYIKQTNRRNKHTLVIIYNKSEYNPKNFLERFLEGEKNKIRNNIILDQL